MVAERFRCNSNIRMPCKDPKAQSRNRISSSGPIALHLSPHSAHGVLAYHRPTKYAAKCAPYAARIGAGQIHPGDQCVGGPCAALIIP
jgi:hypothetical protein